MPAIVRPSPYLGHAAAKYSAVAALGRAIRHLLWNHQFVTDYIAEDRPVPALKRFLVAISYK